MQNTLTETQPADRPTHRTNTRAEQVIDRCVNLMEWKGFTNIRPHEVKQYR